MPHSQLLAQAILSILEESRHPLQLPEIMHLAQERQPDRRWSGKVNYHLALRALRDQDLIDCKFVRVGTRNRYQYWRAEA